MKELPLKVLLKNDTLEIIGLAGVLDCDYLKKEDYEFGFILAKEYWGNGFAYEIGQGQIEYIKNTLKAKRVLALASKENTASINTIKKLGLSYFKTIVTKRGEREVYILTF